MHAAAAAGHTAVVQQLLAAGADPALQGHKGTPLHVAAAGGHAEVVAVLLAHNAPLESATRTAATTPLALSCRYRQTEALQYLLRHNADPDPPEAPDGCFPLYEASAKGSFDVVQALLTHGARVNRRSCSGATALGVAEQKGHAAIARLLREHGAVAVADAGAVAERGPSLPCDLPDGPQDAPLDSKNMAPDAAVPGPPHAALGAQMGQNAAGGAFRHETSDGPGMEGPGGGRGAAMGRGSLCPARPTPGGHSGAGSHACRSAVGPATRAGEGAAAGVTSSGPGTGTGAAIEAATESGPGLDPSSWEQLRSLTAAVQQHCLRLCTGCQQPLGDGATCSVLGAQYHPECVVCGLCKKPIGTAECQVVSDVLYHAHCAERFVLRPVNTCCACQREIDDEGIVALQQTWCASCFVCHQCGGPFEQGFVMAPVGQTEKPFHEECLPEPTVVVEPLLPKEYVLCGACGRAISGGFCLGATVDPPRLHPLCVATGTLRILRDQCRTQVAPFVDPTFPAAKTSLYEAWAPSLPSRPVRWSRPSTFLKYHDHAPGAVLFPDSMALCPVRQVPLRMPFAPHALRMPSACPPHSLSWCMCCNAVNAVNALYVPCTRVLCARCACHLQGRLGNCWFVSALAVMSECSRVVEKLFRVADCDGEVGYYELSLCKNGWWHTVAVDDQLPVGPDGRLSFCHNLDGTLWAPLAEKCYAKVCGSYQSLTSGRALHALIDLTGRPSMELVLSSSEGPHVHPQGLWARLCEWLRRRFLICAGTPGQDTSWCGGAYTKTPFEVKYDGLGLVTGHGYCVLRAQCLSTGDALLQLRNPWGGHTWTGAWSATSPLWTTPLRYLPLTASLLATSHRALHPPPPPHTHDGKETAGLVIRLVQPTSALNASVRLSASVTFTAFLLIVVAGSTSSKALG